MHDITKIAKTLPIIANHYQRDAYYCQLLPRLANHCQILASREKKLINA